MTTSRKDTAFLEVAHTIGQLGTCDRARVGALIVIDGRCVSWGFNGAPPGLPHCDENNHGWGDNLANGCRNATHAEANAIAFAARAGITTEGGTMYCEYSPCANCARLVIAAGIVRFVWSKGYRDMAGNNLLLEAGIRVD